jgi:hypothetical protein
MKNLKNKNYLRHSILFSLFTVLILLVSCSDDDENSGSVSANVPDGVPSGEIVPVEERDFVLTGFDSNTSGRSKAMNQKRWSYEYGEIFSDNCPELDRNISDGYYVSYTPSGNIEYTDQNGDFYAPSKTWEWTEGKNAIIINGNDDAIFWFSELNDDRIIYYSEQSNSECDVVTFESLNEPIFD